MAQITLNSSGVASNGALALQSNGTTTAVTIDTSQNIGVGTASPSGRLHVANTGTAGTTADNLAVYFSSTNRNSNVYILAKNTDGSTINFGDGDSSTVGRISYDHASNYMAFDANGSEQMRLTSTGLGIGTTSPSAPVDIQSNSGGTGIRIRGRASANAGALRFFANDNTTQRARFESNDTSFEMNSVANLPITFLTNDTERMRLDSSGNLGLGVTPSAWSGGKAIQVKNSSNPIFISETAGDGWFGYNSYYNGTNWIYVGSYYANALKMADGQFQFMQAASGTAGNAITFTQAMTLDASGRLGLATTSPLNTLQINSFGGLDGNANQFYLTNNQYYDPTDARDESIKAGYSHRIVLDNNAGGILFQSTSTSAAGANTAITLTERARIDSSGNLMVGTTSTTARFRVVSTATQTQGSYITHPTSGQDVISCENSATAGNNVFIQFYTDATVSRGTISYNRAAGLTTYATTSDYRAKDISGPVTGSGALIDSIPVYMGTMKGATQERPMFLAHETPAYAHTGEKDAVDEDGKPVYQQMDASALIPVMWAEIQSLRVRVAQLESN